MSVHGHERWENQAPSPNPNSGLGPPSGSEVSFPLEYFLSALLPVLQPHPQLRRSPASPAAPLPSCCPSDASCAVVRSGQTCARCEHLDPGLDYCCGGGAPFTYITTSAPSFARSVLSLTRLPNPDNAPPAARAAIKGVRIPRDFQTLSEPSEQRK